MSEAELKLVELDPNKQYVVMFKGYPADFIWEDKPTNVSDIMINADCYTIEDIEKARAASSPQPRTRRKRGTDAK